MSVLSTAHVLFVLIYLQARLAQSAERKALNLVVVGSSPTVGVCVSFCSKLAPKSVQPQPLSLKLGNSRRK